MNLNLVLVILQWIIHLTFSEQSTTPANQHLPLTMRDILLQNIISTERSLLELESRAKEVVKSRLPRQSQRLSRNQNEMRRTQSAESQRQSSEVLEILSGDNPHRHTASQRRQFNKLYKQTEAKNFSRSSDPKYATIHISDDQDQLPQYVCPIGKWACPTPKRELVTCIDIEKLCDYHIDCPRADDEDPIQCAFYRQSQLIIQAQSLQIELLNRQLVQQQHRFHCEMEHLRSQLTGHSHDDSIVRIHQNIHPDESCRGMT